MKFTSAFAVLACAIAAQAATVAQVLTDIAAINTGVTALNAKIQAYPLTGGTLANALAIHTSAAALVNTIKTASADTVVVSPSPFSATDGAAVLAAVENFKPTIVAALSGIVTIKPAFVALPVGGLPALVKADLANLNAATTTFEDALIAKSPAALLAQANAIKATVNSAFATAIAAYA